MNKSESKYFNTAVKMNEAFLRLLSEKEFEYITVTALCKEAGVNRSTFYLHYETIGDLLNETMEYINGKFLSYFKNERLKKEEIQSSSLDSLYFITPKYLTPWLQFTKDNSRLFETFLNRANTLRVGTAYKDLFRNFVSPILSRHNVKKEDHEYVSHFFIEGIIAIVKQWIREKCARPIDEISQLIMQCVKSYEN